MDHAVCLSVHVFYVIPESTIIDAMIYGAAKIEEELSS